MIGRFARRMVGLFAVAALSASLATAVSPRTVLADTPPPPSWSFALSPDNVVPGPGDSNIEPSEGSLSPSDTPGELCPSFDFPYDATSAGIYEAAVGSTGPLVVDLSGYIADYQCTEGVDQAVIDDLVANAADYYFQLSTESFPDGAVRGQLALIPPTIYTDVLAFFCPTGTAFPASDKTLARQCGSMSIPGQDFQGEPGLTSLDYAGMFPWDVHVQAPGFDQHLADAVLAGGGVCDPDTLTCNFGSLPFTFFDMGLGPTTVDVSAVPTGMKLAFTRVTIPDEPGITISTGPGGHVEFDTTGAYQAVPIIRYYFTGSPKLAPPSELAPTAHLAQAPVAANGAVALSLEYGAVTMGDGPVTYAVQVSTDGGAFKGAAAGPKPFASVSELPGHEYRFRVQATNSFGAKSAWATGDPVRLDTIQDNDPAVQYYSDYGDAWQTGATRGALGGTTTWSSDPSADASLSTEAREIGVVMPLEPSGGHATIQFRFHSETVDLSAGTWQPRQVVAIYDFEDIDTQQVDVHAWGDGRIDIDEFVVLH